MLMLPLTVPCATFIPASFICCPAAIVIGSVEEPFTVIVPEKDPPVEGVILFIFMFPPLAFCSNSSPLFAGQPAGMFPLLNKICLLFDKEKFTFSPELGVKTKNRTLAIVTINTKAQP
mgnify:CR=1 FL=1